jgi:hypothetical protein
MSFNDRSISRTACERPVNVEWKHRSGLRTIEHSLVLG